MGLFDFFKKLREEGKAEGAEDSSKKPKEKLTKKHWTDGVFTVEIKNGTLEKVWDINIENGTFVVPKTVKHINMFAFKDCKSLETLVLHDGITYIAPHAFQGCINLKNVVGLDNMPGMKTLTGFTGCSGLERVDLPETVGHIGDSAFKNCVRLQSITLPERTWAISRRAFENCAGLHYLEIPSSITIIEPTAFAGCHNLNITFLPEKPYEGETIDLEIAGKTVAYPTGNVIIHKGSLDDVKSVSAHDQKTIEKVIESGYRGVVSFIDDEKQQTVTMDLGFIERFYGGLAQDQRDIAEEAKRIEGLYYDKFGYPTDDELLEEENREDELGDE